MPVVARPNVNRHSLMNPEQAARQHIDELLTKAGWNVQKSDFPDLCSHRGVAITPRNLDGGDFFRRGGRFAALRQLGLEWQELLEEMNKVLAVA